MTGFVIALLIGLGTGFIFPILVWHHKFQRYFVLEKEAKQVSETVQNLRNELSELEKDRRDGFQESLKKQEIAFEQERELHVQKYNKSREKIAQEQDRLNQIYSQLKGKFLLEKKKLEEQYADAKRGHDGLISKLRDEYEIARQQREKAIQFELKDLLVKMSEAGEEYEKIKNNHEQTIREFNEGYEEAKKAREDLLESDLKSLIDQIQNEQNSLAQVIEENKQKVKESISDLENELLDTTRKYESLQSDLNEAENTIRIATETKSDLFYTERSLLSRRSELSATENQLELLHKEVAETHKKATKRLEEDRHNLLLEIEGLNKEIADLQRTTRALQNTIKGYGMEYLVPGRSLLDDLSEDTSHDAAGICLKESRDGTKQMVLNGQAADCDYSEKVRRETAIKFVIDAFNGKIDSILSRTKSDNYGILSQQIQDAFEIVNLNGQAFRNARITPPYLKSRLSELKFATIAFELRQREREEQRRIKEQMREEEKARREYERAIKEAAKEEDTIKKAMKKAEEMMQAASEAQRAKYEQQLADLEQKLKEAEEKNQRAASMASQTKSGHVYIISNIGSFGENVYKIGMTRRLEPLDRVRELGDASVPFPFDVHAMIFSEDAPKLENTLHKHFLLGQVNKVNYRKEFFRINLEDIKNEIETMGLEHIHWALRAEATQYRETLAIEKQIENDPESREAWLNRQLVIEALFDEEDEEE